MHVQRRGFRERPRKELALVLRRVATRLGKRRAPKSRDTEVVGHRDVALSSQRTIEAPQLPEEARTSIEKDSDNHCEYLPDPACVPPDGAEKAMESSLENR